MQYDSILQPNAYTCVTLFKSVRPLHAPRWADPKSKLLATTPAARHMQVKIALQHAKWVAAEVSPRGALTATRAGPWLLSEERLDEARSPTPCRTHNYPAICAVTSRGSTLSPKLASLCGYHPFRLSSSFKKNK